MGTEGGELGTCCMAATLFPRIGPIAARLHTGPRRWALWLDLWMIPAPRHGGSAGAPEGTGRSRGRHACSSPGPVRAAGSRQEMLRQVACKPGSVRPGGPDRDDHSSGAGVATRFARPTRVVGAGMPLRPSRLPMTPPTTPIRPCSRWGLPCRPRCRGRGALLPHPFTLARRSRRAGGLLSVALSLRLPSPAVDRHRIPVEPGLSSSPGSLPDQRPSSHLARSANRAPRWMRQSLCGGGQRSATAARRRNVPASAAPSTRSGRQRRWKAVSTTGRGRSVR